jgi:hypothetical protein
MFKVRACAAAGNSHPHGWSQEDKSRKKASVSNVSRFGESMVS